jgi:RND family efflux transporter MFP subunit
MSPRKLKPAWIIGAILVLILGVIVTARLPQNGDDQRRPGRDDRPFPVEVAEVRHGPLSLLRTFSGSIEPRAQFTVAPKVSGRLQRLHVDVSDSVSRGQLVAELEDGEFKQAVAEGEARLAVAEANRVEAESRLEIAQRQLERTRTLQERGIASDSALDSARAEFLVSQAAVKVAGATLKREEAALAAARIRLGYTRIKANWQQGDDTRTVAERYTDEGNTVAANTPLFSIVELDPVIGVIMVTERDYPRIAIGQEARLQSDAFPGQVFTGTISRIAPIFRESSRQARVELTLPNPDQLLKPGMFARCTLELARVEKATSVPELAITSRNNRTGVFLVADGGTSVKWVGVEPGIKDGEQVQLIDSDLSGQVVTLGQQLIEDGSTIRIAATHSKPAGGEERP